MPSIEFPSEVPDTISDDMVEAEYQRRVEAFDDLELAVGHATLVGAETWPHSLHTFQYENGEVLLQTTTREVGSAGECLFITVNEVDHQGAYGEHHLTIHDFLVTSSFDAIGYQKSSVWRDPNSHNWRIVDNTGTILQKKFDRVDMTWGKEYVLPPIRSMAQKELAVIDVIQEANVAEHLTAWLSQLNQTSYEPFISQGI